MSNFEFTDRYGGNYPDPATVCAGDCEGMGVYPVYDPEHERFKPRALSDLVHPVDGLTPHEVAEVERIKAEQGVSEDGCYFVRCPDCGGTGKRPA